MARHRILWVEDDYLLPFQATLDHKGYVVDRAYYLSDAVKLLRSNKYDLVLLDVMIPIDEEEDAEFGLTGESTQDGDRSGLEFFRLYREELKKSGVPVLVYTICGDDADVKQAFVAAGLDAQNFVSKVSVSNVNQLASHIERILRYRRPAESAQSGGKK